VQKLQAEHVTEKRMFGGITFLLNGNMLCCASKQGLMVRVGKEAEAALCPSALRGLVSAQVAEWRASLWSSQTALQKRRLWLDGWKRGALM
jgi:TfoX/Sxy family transcriptional regulator of competence genes